MSYNYYCYNNNWMFHLPGLLSQKSTRQQGKDLCRSILHRIVAAEQRWIFCRCSVIFSLAFSFRNFGTIISRKEESTLIFLQKPVKWFTIYLVVSIAARKELKYSKFTSHDITCSKSLRLTQNKHLLTTTMILFYFSICKCTLQYYISFVESKSDMQFINDWISPFHIWLLQVN